MERRVYTVKCNSRSGSFLTTAGTRGILVAKKLSTNLLFVLGLALIVAVFGVLLTLVQPVVAPELVTGADAWSGSWMVGRYAPDCEAAAVVSSRPNSGLGKWYIAQADNSPDDLRVNCMGR
jgi:hypothetical protein